MDRGGEWGGGGLGGVGGRQVAIDQATRYSKPANRLHVE